MGCKAFLPFFIPWQRWWEIKLSGWRLFQAILNNGLIIKLIWKWNIKLFWKLVRDRIRFFNKVYRVSSYISITQLNPFTCLVTARAYQLSKKEGKKRNIFTLISSIFPSLNEMLSAPVNEIFLKKSVHTVCKFVQPNLKLRMLIHVPLKCEQAHSFKFASLLNFDS